MIDELKAIVITNRVGQVIYERFYMELCHDDKSQLRLSLRDNIALACQLKDEQSGVSMFRGLPVVYFPISDIILFGVGSAISNETVVCEILRSVLGAIRICVKKPVSEALLHEKYARIAVAIDDVAFEGISECTDPEDIRRLAKIWS